MNISRTPIRWKIWLPVFLSLCVMSFLLLNIYEFLALPTKRVAADVLIVEGWGGPRISLAAFEEYKTGQYQQVVVAAALVEQEGTEPAEPLAKLVAEDLVRRGIPAARLLVASPNTGNWNKTAKTARAACALLREKGIHPKGLNVITFGLHARRSRLAYIHAIGPGIPVGHITIPNQRFINRPWWSSPGGFFLVAKSLIGWIREYLSEISQTRKCTGQSAVSIPEPTALSPSPINSTELNANIHHLHVARLNRFLTA